MRDTYTSYTLGGLHFLMTVRVDLLAIGAGRGDG
jgi:hypothetical protein